MSDLTRTTCACRDCVQCCRDQPGSLSPGDFDRIADHLQVPEAERDTFARVHFWASPGAVVGRREGGTIKTYRIGTVTPQRVKGQCVFLDEQNRCRIHPVAPFGCAYFDTHMDAAEGQRRSLTQIISIVNSPAYTAWRETLPVATTWRPRKY